MQTCECGCREVVTEGRRFRQGHYIRVNHPTRSLAVRKKISESRLGDKNPAKRPEVRRKISANRKGKGMGDRNASKRPEVRAKMSKRMMGERNPMYGKSPVFTEETRRKISEAQRGSKNHHYGKPLSAEAKRKISLALKGRPLSDEHKRNIRLALNTPEMRAKLSAADMKRNQKGENHPNWRGGISSEPYSFEFDANLKCVIRERDDFSCQNCGKREEQIGRTLHIHHIDYDKRNNEETNLVTLCPSCHSKTLFGRQAWMAMFAGRTQPRLSYV